MRIDLFDILKQDCKPRPFIRSKSVIEEAGGSRSQAFVERFRSIGMSTRLLARSSFPFSPVAIVLSLSFLRRWQVKRPIRAGQRGRTHHSPRIPNSVEKERYSIERLFSLIEIILGRGETDRDWNIGRVRDRCEREIRPAMWFIVIYVRGEDCSLHVYKLLTSLVCRLKDRKFL